MTGRQAIQIIVVDDEPIVCERLKPILEKKGYNVETYTGSQEAIQRLSEKKFHILVTDMKMSGPKGIDIIRAAQASCPQIQSIVISGYATQDMANEAYAAGAIEFLPKPFRLVQLCDLIEKIAAEIQRKHKPAKGEPS